MPARRVARMSPEVLVGALLGAFVGLAADRLAARWPVHADGGVRAFDWRSFVVIIGGALAFGGLAGRWPDLRDLVVLGIYGAALIVLLATDLDQRLLPDLITLPLIAYAAVVTFLPLILDVPLNPLLEGKSMAALSAIGAAVLAPVLLLVSDRVFKGALGMGDVKLSISLGLLCGISLFFVGFLVATVAFAAIVLVLLVARRLTLKTAIPFGPALIGAGVVAMLLPA
jgi:leader peptidase (prepilin peptidase)/N-methyltransferase